MTQKFESHITAIKKLDQHYGQILTTLTHRQSGSLPSEMVQNPPTFSHCLDINTMSGSSPDDHYIPNTKKLNKDNIVADEPRELEVEKLTYSDDNYESEYGDNWVADETKDEVQNFRTISPVPLVEKKEDPSVVTISCFMGVLI